MKFIKKFVRQDNDWFSNSRSDIRRQNYLVLRNACVLYLLILLFYTALTYITHTSRLLTILYTVYDFVHIVFLIIVFRTSPSRHSTRLCDVYRLLFEAVLFTFFIAEAVIPFPTQQSIYFPFPLIMIVTLFSLHFSETIITSALYVGVFTALTCVYKTGTVRTNDIYIAAGTFVCAMAGYIITANIRHESNEAASRLKALSMRDELTGLYNKKTFEALCKAFIENYSQTRSYAMLFIDVDKFKTVNDVFGHQVGDAVLKSVSRVMKESFYDKDYLCRFGGDEFVAFMADADSLENVKERVSVFKNNVAALSKTLKLDELSCSVGIAMKKSPEESYSELLASADAEMYVVKNGGERNVSFEEQYFTKIQYSDTGAELPTASVEDKPEKPKAFADPRAIKRRVVVVDDNELNRQVLHKILSSSYEVLEATNGREAIDMLNAAYKSISAVLLDIVMPVMDGYEVLEIMKADVNLSNIPVIVMTASSDEQTEEKALSLGAKDFVTKPYSPTIIMHRLKNTINLRETAAIINAAERDRLTGLYTKEFFYEKADAVIKAENDIKYDIICSDISHFKTINELFGTKTGDALLKYIAEILASAVNGNGIVGRVGADKFACLMEHYDGYCFETFDKMTKRLNEFPVSIDLNMAHGVYVIDDKSVPVSLMCDRALTALNSVKGRYDVNFAYYDDAFRRKTLAEQFILDGMKAALEQRQFVVYYQAKYDLYSERIIGAEALVRWIHPEKGLMPPSEFIPVFENNGFITDLDVYVWDTVCRDMSGWIEEGKNVVPISVNVSRADIYNPRLLEMLSGLIEKYGLSYDLMHLEITETAYTEDSEQLIAAVGRLIEKGFLIEMDDFGSGYSSLNMLSELPIDILKLDMSFISEMANDKKQRILRAVTYLAKQLNLPMIAEGVETKSQVELLRDLDCDFAQGYYYAKPMEKKLFEEKLFNQKKER